MNYSERDKLYKGKEVRIRDIDKEEIKLQDLIKNVDKQTDIFLHQIMKLETQANSFLD